MSDAKPSPPPRKRDAVMVSSTFEDLKDLRQLLMDAAHSAGLFPEAMEHDAALPGPDVIEASLEKVRSAAGYVLLIGHRYGQQPACAVRNPQQRSITELEFEEALACGRPTLVFILGDDYLLPKRHVEQDGERIRRLEAFRTRARSMDGSGSGVERVYKIVESREELVRAATSGLRDLASLLAAPVDTPHPPADPPAPGGQPPAPPARYAVPAYIGSHPFVGRAAELALLDDWAAPEDQHPLLLFDAIGGSGKSMLTWHWFEQQAPARRAWAGRFWYSFYETGASMADCCRHALAYIGHRPLAEFQRRPVRELMHALVEQLRAQPWLLVLDGLERVLVAYHRSDAATIADEALEKPSDQIARRDPCTAAHPDDDELLRQLSAAAPSKILVSSRLVPQALLNRAHQAIPGVRREPLRGLRPEDAVLMLQRCGVRGDPAAMQRYLQAHCDGHPLVIGALGGLIAEPFPAAGDFDRWGTHPAGGEKLDLGQLDLVNKRNHILRAAIEAVPEKGRELLGTLALLHGGIDRVAIEALNPHRPAEPEEVEEPEEPEEQWDWKFLDEAEQVERREHHDQRRAERDEYLRAYAAWQASPEVKAAPAALAATLRDLQQRGLLQVGEGSEPQFDLHPVVRGIVSAGLVGDATERLGQRVVDHFSRRAHDPYEQAQTLQDLEGGLHLVRTLLRMGRFKQALDAWHGDLEQAMGVNVLAWHDMLALLKPLFPNGWLKTPRGVDEGAASYLMNDVAMALCNTGLLQESIQVFCASLQLGITLRKPSWLVAGLGNLADALAESERLADAQTCLETALRVGQASGDEEVLFCVRLDLFEHATVTGDWSYSEALWVALNVMGRDWSRAVYRPGSAEFSRAVNLWFQDRSPAEPLAAAERLARDANARGELRRTLELRGEWKLAQGDASAAIEAFEESARLARASGQADLDTECWLALVRHQAGQLRDPRAEAERLQSAGAEGYPLARLWLAAGDHEQARAQALRYHRWAWADGEPYVRRFQLNRARQLLAELNEPEPVLPPYDPASRQRFDWEDEVEAAIADLEKQKAERDRPQKRRPRSKRPPPT